MFHADLHFSAVSEVVLAEVSLIRTEGPSSALSILRLKARGSSCLSNSARSIASPLHTRDLILSPTKRSTGIKGPGSPAICCTRLALPPHCGVGSCAAGPCSGAAVDCSVDVVAGAVGSAVPCCPAMCWTCAASARFSCRSCSCPSDSLRSSARTASIGDACVTVLSAAWCWEAALAVAFGRVLAGRFEVAGFLGGIL